MELRTCLIDGWGAPLTEGFDEQDFYPKLLKDVLPSAPEVSRRPGQRG
jgi:hypothetical protein